MDTILEQMNFDVKRSFWTEKDNELWLEDINTNPNAHQKHWKPEDRDLTMEELKKQAGAWANTQQLEADLYFSRTSENDMQLLTQFIVENKKDIEYITDVDLLIERGNIKKEYHSILQTLEKPEEEPEKYPEEERYIPDIQGGQLLCKSWSPTPFYVTYGKVNRPRFLKEKIYKEELYNNIYRDKQGYSYLLIPLNDFSPNFAETVYEQAWQMGLREHPNFFIPFVYSYEMNNVREVGKDFAEFYSAEELTERLMLSLENLLPELHALAPNKPLTLNGHGLFKWSWTKTSISNHKIQLLNALTIALKQHYGTLYDWDIKKKTLTFKKGKISVSPVTV